MFVCICKGIREEDVRQLGERGVVEAADLRDALELDSAACCGRCMRNLDEFVALARPMPRGTLEQLPLVGQPLAAGG